MIINIAIVDDEELILEGVRMLLSMEKSISVTITSKNGIDFLDNLDQLNPTDLPHIALVDIQMQPMDGFELVEILRERYPELKIIILSSHYKSSVLGYMVKLGVSAFLPKNSNKKTFIEAITKVHQNGIYFTAEDHNMLLSYLNDSQKNRGLFDNEGELSDREKEVVKLICKEMTNQEIAEKLSLSPRTVESHRQRILDKIGAKNTVGLVIYAVVNGIYDLPLRL